MQSRARRAGTGMISVSRAKDDPNARCISEARIDPSASAASCGTVIIMAWHHSERNAALGVYYVLVPQQAKLVNDAWLMSDAQPADILWHLIIDLSGLERST